MCIRQTSIFYGFDRLKASKNFNCFNPRTYSDNIAMHRNQRRTIHLIPCRMVGIVVGNFAGQNFAHFGASGSRSFFCLIRERKSEKEENLGNQLRALLCPPLACWIFRADFQLLRLCRRYCIERGLVVRPQRQHRYVWLHGLPCGDPCTQGSRRLGIRSQPHQSADQQIGDLESVE